MSDRFGKQEATLDDVDVPTGNQFGFDGELDLSVEFYGEAPASNFLPHISKSRIKTYAKCKRDFANTYLAGERADENFYIIRGSEVHEAFEKFHQNLIAFLNANWEEPQSLTDLMPHASNWFQFVEYVGPFFEWELKRLETARENTDTEKEALEAWMPHSVEVSLEVEDPPVGDTKWLGPYDVLVDARSVPSIEQNEGYVILDYKTGSLPKVQYRDKGIHIDLEFYAWILEQHGFNVAGAIGVYPSEDENVVRTMPNEDTRELITEIIENLHSDAVTRSNFEINENPLCDWCHFQDQCPSSW